MRGHLIDCGPCPYLPERTFQAFQPADDVAPIYRDLMDLRFRRSGRVFYLPRCAGCQACRPLRIDIAAFRPRRDQRRCARRNHDLTVTWAGRGSDAEREALYRRYETTVHGRSVTDDGALASLADGGGVDGGELHARDADGRLVAVSIVDRFADALSSVYCYYDPDRADRALGTFMVLGEIAQAHAAGLAWLYLGFHVADAPKMRYKARFYPHQILVDGRWRTYREPDASPVGSAGA